MLLWLCQCWDCVQGWSMCVILHLMYYMLKTQSGLISYGQRVRAHVLGNTAEKPLLCSTHVADENRGAGHSPPKVSNTRLRSFCSPYLPRLPPAIHLPSPCKCGFLPFKPSLPHEAFPSPQKTPFLRPWDAATGSFIFLWNTCLFKACQL